jgi:hypothetical protein
MHRLRTTLPALFCAALFGCTGVPHGPTGPDAAPSLGVSQPEAAASAVPDRITVGGSGHWTVNDELRTFAFHALERSDGEIAGTFELHNRSNDSRIHGRVVCVSTFADYAWIGGVIESSAVAVGSPPSGEVVWRVRDNGEGTDGAADQVSLMSVNLSPGAAERFCLAHPLLVMHRIESGNVQVLPTVELSGAFSGIWQGVRLTPSGGICCGFRWELSQTGNAIAGKLFGPHSGCANIGGCPVTGVVNGNTLEFEVRLTFLPFEVIERGTAMLDGETMSGTIRSCQGETCGPPLAFNVTRQ